MQTAAGPPGRVSFKWVYSQAFKIRYQSLNTLYERLSNDPTMGFTDAVNVLGVKVILFLQATFPSWANFFMKVSRIGDPSLAFTFYFPLTAALDLRQGRYLLWTLILCEWFNMILKWVLAGDRPYWWVHEAPYYIHKNLPFVRQYPMTCETGPGMPSGHSTLNAALFFILVRGLTSFLQPHLRTVFSEKKCLWINRIIWMIYGSWIGLVMVSRIFIGTHFPHQCVAGALIGITTALWVNYTNVFDAMTQKKSFLITAVMLTTVGGVFGTYRTLGNDPMWSVNKAVRWCLKREFIHIDSIPFYALSRYSGQSLGLGLALASSSFAQVNPSRFSWKMKLSLAILTLTAGQASDFLHRILPPTLVGYYVLEFLLNASLAYLVITLLPKLVMRSSGVKSKAKAKKP